MNPRSIWSALEDVYDILGGYGFPAMDKAATEMELKPDWSTWLFAIWLFGSEPITTANFMRIFPYGLAQHNEEGLASAVQQGYLISSGKNGYTPTEFGLKAAHKVWREAGDSLASMNPMPEAQMEKGFDYLARIGDAALSAPEPPSHYCMSHKRENYKIFPILYPMERFIILFGELAAYRDDIYVAKWSAHRVDGHAWEVLDFLSQSGALTSADLHSKLSRRGITEEVHAEDVKELIRRGWVEEDSGKVQITAAGKQARAEVEAETERLFFAPWSCLNKFELEELLRLAEQLRDGLRSMLKP
jgi:Mn-dependent DtxR family transcriptional regulator